MLDPSDNIFIKWWNVSYLCGSIYILDKILYKRYTVWLGVGGGRGGTPSLTLESSDFLAQWLKFPPQLPPTHSGPCCGHRNLRSTVSPSGQIQITQLLPTRYHIIAGLSTLRTSGRLQHFHTTKDNAAYYTIKKITLWRKYKSARYWVSDTEHSMPTVQLVKAKETLSLSTGTELCAVCRPCCLKAYTAPSLGYTPSLT